MWNSLVPEFSQGPSAVYENWVRAPCNDDKGWLSSTGRVGDAAVGKLEDYGMDGSVGSA